MNKFGVVLAMFSSFAVKVIDSVLDLFGAPIRDCVQCILPLLLLSSSLTSTHTVKHALQVCDWLFVQS